MREHPQYRSRSEATESGFRVTRVDGCPPDLRVASRGMTNLTDFTMTSITGEAVDFHAYAGRVVLVVNVASY